MKIQSNYSQFSQQTTRATAERRRHLFSAKTLYLARAESQLAIRSAAEVKGRAVRCREGV